MPDQQQAPPEPLAVLGAGSFGEEVADLVRDDGSFSVAAFVEGQRREICGQELRGLPVIWIDDLDRLPPACRGICAVGSTARESFIRAARRLGLEFATFVHRRAQVSPSATLGPGCIVGPKAVIAAHTRLGAHVIVNRGALVGHHARIGDFVTLSPGANVAGRTHLADRVTVGMGGLVLDGRSVGEGSIVGAGAVVTKDVPERVQVLGVPARVTKRLPIEVTP